MSDIEQLIFFRQNFILHENCRFLINVAIYHANDRVCQVCQQLLLPTDRATGAVVKQLVPANKAFTFVNLVLSGMY